MLISDALQRVRAYLKPSFLKIRKPYYSGFYLTNEQIIELGNYLKNHPDRPQGMTFLVGKTDRKYTVEMIPYKSKKLGKEKRFYEGGGEGGYLGHISIHLSPEHDDSHPFYWNNNNSAPGGGVSQRTPPPPIQ